MTHTQTQGADGAGTKTAGEPLDLRDLHAANIARQAEWCPDQVPDLSFRGNELGGECGEAQNVIKKLERERRGWRGSRATKDDLADELADVVICADLCAVTAGIDLGAAVRRKFNATSEKQGLSVFLPMPSTPAPAATPGVPDSLRALDGADEAVFACACARWVRTLIATHPAGQSEDDPERCIACDKPLKAGELVLPDAEGGTIHTACCGPERESYTGADGGPLGPNDPIPQGYVYEGEQPTGQERPDRKWVCNGDPAQPARQAGDAGADVAEWKERLERAFYDAGGFHGQMVEYAARTALPVLLAAIKSTPNNTRTGAAEPCLRAVVEVYSGRTDTRLTFGKGVKHEGGCKAVEQAIIALQAELDQRDACPAAGGPSAGYGGTGAKALSAAILEQCAYPRICSSNGRVAEGIRCGPCERKALAAALAARPEAPSDAGWRERVRHVKRGTEYEVLGEAEAQVSGSDSRITESRDWLTDAIILEDGDKLTVYRGTDGRLWCRPTDEMRDGRFEIITPPSDPSPSGQAEG